jgi:hypothetical protein
MAQVQFLILRVLAMAETICNERDALNTHSDVKTSSLALLRHAQQRHDHLHGMPAAGNANRPHL